MDGQRRSDGRSARPIQLGLLGSFQIAVHGREITLPLSAQRVLVALALRQQNQDRTVLGEVLYPNGRRSQAMASLRTALWRAKHETGHMLVHSSGQRLCLDESVEVDVRRWVHLARSMTSQSRAELAVDSGECVEVLSKELLPAWSEEWLILERQRWDLLRLHALERLAERFAAGGQPMNALEAGLAAVAIEPYRESAHRAVISAHIAEGNRASALAQYHQCQRILARDLGVRPTAQLQALVQALTGD